MLHVRFLLTASLLKALKGGLEMDENWCDWASLDKPGKSDYFVALAVGQNEGDRLKVFAGGL